MTTRPPMPWIAVNRNRAKPTKKVEAIACCQGKGRGFLLENDHMVNAGDAWIPISENMYVRIMIPVQVVLPAVNWMMPLEPAVAPGPPGIVRYFGSSALI